MNDHSDDLDLLRSVVTKGAEVPESSIERLGRQRVFTLLLAGTAVAVERRFGSRADTRGIAELIEDLKERFSAKAHDIDPLITEAVVRAGLGEPELLTEITNDDMTSMMVLVTYAIINQDHSTPAQLEDFCAEALRFADTLTAPGTPETVE